MTKAVPIYSILKKFKKKSLFIFKLYIIYKILLNINYNGITFIELTIIRNRIKLFNVLQNVE